MSNIECNTEGCSQMTVAKCMHCNNTLCLRCLTRHQQPIESQISQLTNDMNKLLSLSTINENDTTLFIHPQTRIQQQFASVMEEIDLWEMTMTKQLNEIIKRARATVRTSFEQISFEIEEWSTEKQIQLQSLANDIEQINLKTDDESQLRKTIDDYYRQLQEHFEEYQSIHVEFRLLDKQSIVFSPTTLQLFHLFEHSPCFDLSLICNPPAVCFDASKSSASQTLPSLSSPSNALHRREKFCLPSVLISTKDRLLLFSNRAKQMYVFSMMGALIDQFSCEHSDVVDMCYDRSTSTETDDIFYILSSNGSVFTLIYHSDQHLYSWVNLISVNNQTYYTQILCDTKLSYLYLFMPSKHRLDQWTISKSNRSVVHCSNQFVITNDHVEHLCSSYDRLALLLRDKNKILNYRIEMRHFTDLLVPICVINIDRLSKPMRIIFDNRGSFILSHGNQMCSFGKRGQINSKRIFQEIQEIKRATFCHRSTLAILTETDQLLFYIFSK